MVGSHDENHRRSCRNRNYRHVSSLTYDGRISGFNLEIWFPSQEEVSVFMETTFSSDEEPEFGMLGLFSLFAARTATNLNGSPAQRGLGSALLGFRSGGNGYPAGLLAQNDGQWWSIGVTVISIMQRKCGCGVRSRTRPTAGPGYESRRSANHPHHALNPLR